MIMALGVGELKGFVLDALALRHVRRTRTQQPDFGRKLEQPGRDLKCRLALGAGDVVFVESGTACGPLSVPGQGETAGAIAIRAELRSGVRGFRVPN